MGQLQPSTVNQQRTLRLRQALKTAGCTVIEVVGCAPDGSHAELGFAIQCTEAQARALCVEYAQLAFYMVEDGQVHLHAAMSVENRFVAQWSQRVRIEERGNLYEL